ncbi:hypothetical protein [Flavobacterium fluviale]|uniref:LPXTG-motif cell wall anchor domain-containing protein n=1 Tax=Flavobacterium fluviale TaxID=2249356 RepID=A0A344LNY4_9FLAO|nr:hypothetical protein [Flavobacterium fluviale]AXB55626.1 hypothetical protein HYN86_03010 [Flavobacterium fluviale]
MKNLKAPFLAVALILFNISIVSAGSTPPPPNARMATSTDNDDLEDDNPGMPTFPIDNNMMILLISGLALGAVVIYRNQTKKASI